MLTATPRGLTTSIPTVAMAGFRWLARKMRRPKNGHRFRAGRAWKSSSTRAITDAPNNNESTGLRDGLQRRDSRRHWWTEDLHSIVATAEQAARGHRHRAWLQFAQRLLSLGRGAVRRERPRGLCARSSRPRQVRWRTVLHRKFSEYQGDVGPVRDAGAIRDPGLPVFLLGPQRRRRDRLQLHAGSPGRVHGPHLREFCLRVPAPDFALAVLKGMSPSRTARACAQAQERGFFARPAGRRRR